MMHDMMFLGYNVQTVKELFDNNMQLSYGWGTIYKKNFVEFN